MTHELTIQNTAIVLDSTCDAPAGFFDRAGLFMVPLKVHFGDEMYRDGIDITHDEFYAKLGASATLPTTSQPTVGEFTAVYEAVTKEYEHVFSIHISAEMSGTVQAARQAAEAFPGVEVFDTRNVTSGMALCAERLRFRLERGTTLEELRDYMAHTIANSRLMVHVATLEYLRRGGRIGRAASLVGGVLDLKPLIQNVDGLLAPYAKVRGQKKAEAAMERFLNEFTKPTDDLYYVLIDALNDDEPPRLKSLIERVRPNAHFVFYGKVGAVVGTHIGPGTAGFAFIAE